jgi:hypothetical protein
MNQIFSLRIHRAVQFQLAAHALALIGTVNFIGQRSWSWSLR